MINSSGKQRFESDVNSDRIWRGVIKNEDYISRDWRHTYGFLDKKPKIDDSKKFKRTVRRIAVEREQALANPPQRKGNEIRKRYLFIQDKYREIPLRLQNREKKEDEEYIQTSTNVDAVVKRLQRKKFKKEMKKRKEEHERQKKEEPSVSIEEEVGKKIQKQRKEDDSKDFHDLTENSRYGFSLKTFGHVDFKIKRYNRKKNLDFERNIV